MLHVTNYSEWDNFSLWKHIRDKVLASIPQYWSMWTNQPLCEICKQGVWGMWSFQDLQRLVKWMQNLLLMQLCLLLSNGDLMCLTLLVRVMMELQWWTQARMEFRVKLLPSIQMQLMFIPVPTFSTLQYQVGVQLLCQSATFSTMLIS